jgi:hypothetical protein
VRRLLVVFVACLGFLAAGGGVANAESQTVNGTDGITRLKASNGTNAVTANVFGLGSPCGGAWYLHVEVRNRAGKLLYMAEGSCISAEWHTGLFYEGGAGEPTAVRCRNFSFTRNRTTGAFRIEMPRGCLDHAPDRIKVRAEGADYGAMTEGVAGPTRLLARG